MQNEQFFFSNCRENYLVKFYQKKRKILENFQNENSKNPHNLIKFFSHFVIAAWTPLRSTDENLHPTNTRWIQNGLIAVGGNGQGHGINQLDSPYGLYVDDDDDQTVYVADSSNHRIVKWKKGATNGQVVVGGNGKGSGAHQ
ncbi:unnamed protein product [Rotaria magnacalcarata]|uniref:Uncharacterized protein n=1 Tax=Rotaria magnacalcarata TaxID=392030 RepID=A0A816QQ08_9BILA|nr:unnamed protein product [Rotaria magnacalcarata]CAF1480492.1 unnamed protein product [Rotaria magnacalcarata]CAF2064807.1 unnamed protein product [Rotaria magnacalcarata]